MLEGGGQMSEREAIFPRKYCPREANFLEYIAQRGIYPVTPEQISTN